MILKKKTKIGGVKCFAVIGYYVNPLSLSFLLSYCWLILNSDETFLKLNAIYKKI